MTTEPTDVPSRLGPYRVDGLWHADDVGVVLDGQGPQGRVELVILAAGPNGDATARARFTTAAEGLQRDGRLVAAGSSGDVPWVALDAGTGPKGAQPLLAPIWPDVVEDEVVGPTYVPHWRGMPSSYPRRPMPLPAHQRLPWWWWLVGLLIALGVFLLLAACVAHRQQSAPSDGGSSSSSSSSPSSSGSSSSSSSSSSTSSSGGSSSSSSSSTSGGPNGSSSTTPSSGSGSGSSSPTSGQKF